MELLIGGDTCLPVELSSEIQRRINNVSEP